MCDRCIPTSTASDDFQLVELVRLVTAQGRFLVCSTLISRYISIFQTTFYLYHFYAINTKSLRKIIHVVNHFSLNNYETRIQDV